MIPLLLWSMRMRVLLVAVLCWLFYLYEPGFHQHGEVAGPLTDPLLLPTGIAFTLANLAAASMLVLLAGFIAADRRRGYYRLFFAHPTRPEAYYGLRWGLAYLISLLAAAAFLLLGQLAAWGELRVSPAVLLQAALFALVYGGVLAFLSALLPRGDALVAVALFFLTDFWHLLTGELGAEPLTPLLRQVVSFVLPPHLAVSDVYLGLVAGSVPVDAALFAAGYGVFWLAAAALLLRLREWP
ncbi:MAG TPA: hypothetical protein VEW03_02150 [Longimicrobiaceae bacterium]|nr:hypothetical protein [Longimicrobiaceae bacterium]